MSIFMAVPCRRKYPEYWGFIFDQRGVSAVEFALILPIMLLLYFGSAEVAQGVALNRMVALTASTVTNLVTQYTTISASSQMPDILNASAQVLAPYPSSNATVVVTCITIDASGRATVAWSQALNGTAKTAGQSIAIPTALDTPNTTVVLGETTYSYTPVFDFIHIGTLQLYSSQYMLPRASTTINLTN
jgi:Flp pilus assembly protein TadG